MWMLQKVDWDVVYVAMVIHVCCKRLFQMFQLFQTNVARLGIAYVFVVMLQIFYLGVAYVSHLCYKCFIQMLHMF
jgi:hypothetical protein